MRGRFWFDEVGHCYWREKDGVKTPLIGTTRITGSQDKPGLTWWASSKALEPFGYLNPKKNSIEACREAALTGMEKVKAMSAGEYAAFLDSCYRAHDVVKKDLVEDGKALHKLLEEFILARMSGHDPLFIDPKIKDFVGWSDKNVKRFLFSEICCFSDVLNVGGTADWAYEDVAGNYVLGDFKSAENAYYPMYLQCGGYDLQLSENGGFTKDGRQVFKLDKSFQRYEIFASRAGLDKPFSTTETNRLRRAFSYNANAYRERVWWEGTIDKRESGVKVFGRR